MYLEVALVAEITRSTLASDNVPFGGSDCHSFDTSCWLASPDGVVDAATLVARKAFEQVAAGCRALEGVTAQKSVGEQSAPRRLVTFEMKLYDIWGDSNLRCKDLTKCSCSNLGETFTHKIGLEACKHRCLTSPSCEMIYCDDGSTPCSCHEYKSCVVSRTPISKGVHYQKTEVAHGLVPLDDERPIDLLLGACQQLRKAPTIAPPPLRQPVDTIEPPSHSELLALYNKFATKRHLSDLEASIEDLNILGRCLHHVMNDAYEQATNCRVLLVFAYGSARLMPRVGSIDFPYGECRPWAWLCTPDRTLDDRILASAYGMLGRTNGFQPPLLKRPGGIILDVGADVGTAWNMETVAQARHVHVFEATTLFQNEVTKRWAKYSNVTVHPYGLAGATRTERAPLADQSTSLFSAVHISGGRFYLDGIGDPSSGRDRRKIAELRVRSAAGVWAELKLTHVALLLLNCEGCEYEVLQDLAHAGLARRIETIQMDSHMVLEASEVEKFCDKRTGTCPFHAAFAAYDRYCDLVGVLSKTHRRVFGLPFHRGERWERLPRALGAFSRSG